MIHGTVYHTHVCVAKNTKIIFNCEIWEKYNFHILLLTSHVAFLQFLIIITI